MQTFARVLALGAILGAAAFAPAALKWETNYQKALAESKRTGKPILADFTGSDWCGWCIRLHKEVFDTPQFAAWAKKNVILLELDYPMRKAQPAAIKKQNDRLVKQFKVEGYPTILFINGQGKEIGRYGYDSGGPKKWIPNAEKKIRAKK